MPGGTRGTAAASVRVYVATTFGGGDVGMGSDTAVTLNRFGRGA
jgi:hypothetical protein